MIKKLVVSFGLLCSGVVVAAPFQPGDAITLHGRLQLRGNEPFAYAVVVDKTGVWKLNGVSRPVAAQLQNHVVQIYGTVCEQEPAGLAVKVESVESDEQ